MPGETAPHRLSKSAFIRGVQCVKSLYLHRYHPELRDEEDPRLRGVFASGSEVGVLARTLFPGGILASPDAPDNLTEAVERTRRLIGEGARVLYEAAFVHDGTLCLIDILAREEGRWRAYEVKSSTGVSETHLLDAALQYHVITGSGLPLEDISIVHINNRYTRRGELDIRALFSIKSVHTHALRLGPSVRETIARLKTVLDSDAVPDVEIGEHCFSPYECDFRGHCWSGVPDDSVFELTHASKHQEFELYRGGITRLADISPDYGLNDAQRLQVECARTGADYADREGLRAFLAGLRRPLYFMDFETFMPAVPLFDSSRPYQQIPFQYSLHFQAKRGGEARHREFLAEGDTDPRRAFIERLLADTGAPGDIVVYNKGFEAGRLDDLALLFPDLAAAIHERIGRIKDLMVPFRARYYYTPAMKGRYSIKNVLPALVPEMGYDDLAIGDGYMAMSAYSLLRAERDTEKAGELRKNLLAYCRLDTLAMVKILERLEEIVGGHAPKTVRRKG